MVYAVEAFGYVTLDHPIQARPTSYGSHKGDWPTPRSKAMGMIGEDRIPGLAE